MLKVFGARSMHGAVTSLSHRFAEDSGSAPDILFEPMGALQARLAAGENAGVLILAAPAIDALLTSRALVSGSPAAVAPAPIGLAIREGAPALGISTADALQDAKTAPPANALSRPAAGGS